MEGTDLLIESTELDSHCVVVKVTGDVDVFTADRYRAILLDLVDRGFREIVLDLSEAGTFDSTAMGATLKAHVKLVPLQGVLRLAAPPPRLQWLFELTHFGDVVAVHPTVDAALRAAKASATN